MSSHHIVREKQEPALLALGLDGFPDELLGQLLEWSPTVITTPQTAEKLNVHGIKIDWIITDNPSEVFQSDVKLMPCGQSNLTETALNFLIDGGYPAVNIVTDDLELKDYAFFADKIDLVIFNNNKKIYPVKPGFSKWKPSGEFIGLCPPANNLHVTGLEKTTNGQYKTTHDGFFGIRFDGPFLFISEDV